MRLHIVEVINTFRAVDEDRRSHIMEAAQGVDDVETSVHLACRVLCSVGHALDDWHARLVLVAVLCGVEQLEADVREQAVNALLAVLNLLLVELGGDILALLDVG